MNLNYLSDQFVFWNLKKIKHGYLELTDYRGKKYSFGKKDSELKAQLNINDPRFTQKLLRKGSSGLGESYINSEFETNDLPSLIELSAKNIDITYKFSGLLQFSFLQNLFNYNIFLDNKESCKKNISFHYDLGNEFFSIWLDKTLTYSCGIFNSNDETLEKAQINKYDKLINVVKPKKGDKILEIGCGWGGFAEHIAKSYDIRIDCITISKKQFLFTKERIRKAGLNHKVNVQMLDYREVKNKYDIIVSIEMIEAVGEKYLDQYFRTIKNCLYNGGQAAIQGITIKDELFERYRNSEDFIQKYIFPGGFLPSLNQLKKITKQNNLALEKINFYSDDYAKTLFTWKKNFLSAWDNISPLGFDDYFKRMWEFYLSYCEAGFKSKNIDLIQFSMSNR